jgi:hypothetical protein
MEPQKSELFAGEIDIGEDFVVLDDATTYSPSQLDLSNLRKRKTKIMTSAKETIENGEFRPSHCPTLDSFDICIAFRTSRISG